ncbi:type II toxin-antitoxin system VapB family antitoxin [Galactobacter sp.]|uniref:type II toxin-antitoxin system VapB family antitoxin n=1 Tax=Galactobacter sp. TaxID=2676125 RepID=UPI0025BEFC51|nr:type II toxin-antitoxin system VapB family antitoxin [Galactobacter sp.]
MRTTVALDDDLMEEASRLTGVEENAVIIRNAVAALVRHEDAKRLYLLGDSDPEAEAAPRRRPAVA